MIEFQFLHIARYGRHARKSGSRWATISGIVAEAARVPEACTHVASPLPIRILYGSRPTDIVAEAEHLSRTARDTRGRLLRSDGGILVAGVASYPTRLALVQEDPIDRDFLGRWESETVDFIGQTFGTALRYIVAHDDEEFPHLHFGALPELAPDQTLNWRSAHPGIYAARSIATKGGTKAEQNEAYVSAMRDLQDRFYADVGSVVGHARFGPRRQREARREYLEKKRSEEARRNRRAQLDTKARELYERVRNKAFEAHRNEIRNIEAERDAAIAQFMAIKAKYEAIENKLAELESTMRPPMP